MTTITIKRAGYRPLTPRELDCWMDNWAKWLGETEEIYPQFEVSDATSSPQHWEAPVRGELVTEAYSISAERVEGIIHADDFAYAWRSAVITEYHHLPDKMLRRLLVPLDRWLIRRAYKADLVPRTYTLALDLGLARLASTLGRYRGELAT